MITALCLLLSLIFLLLSALHFYWTAGGKWALAKSLPTNPTGEKMLTPGVLPTLYVALVLLSFAILYLLNSGLLHLPIPEWIIRYSSWFVPTIFTLRAIGDFRYAGFFKKIKETEFAKADTKIFVPLCLFIGIAGFVIMLL